MNAPQPNPGREPQITSATGDADRLILPEAPPEGFYRAIHDAYLNSCRAGLQGGSLLTKVSTFNSEDMGTLASMAKAYREGTYRVISSGGANPVTDYHYRALHPVVFDRGEQRSRNIYVEVFNQEKTPVLVCGNYVEVLPPDAAVATRVFSWSGVDRNFEAQYLLSSPAFQVLVDRSRDLTLEKLRANPFQSLLLGWVLQTAYQKARYPDPAMAIKAQDLTSLKVEIDSNGILFLFDTDQRTFRAECRLDPVLFKPDIWVFSNPR